MEKLPKNLIKRLLKEHGAKRVSKEARDFMAEKIRGIIEDTVPIAVKNAKHFGRKLLTKEDIEMACQEPPVKDRWHDNATLHVVLEHYQNSTSNSNHKSKTCGILKFKKIKGVTY